MTRSPIRKEYDMKSATADTRKRPESDATDLPLPVLPPPTIKTPKGPLPNDSATEGWL